MRPVSSFPPALSGETILLCRWKSVNLRGKVLNGINCKRVWHHLAYGGFSKVFLLFFLSTQGNSLFKYCFSLQMATFCPKLKGFQASIAPVEKITFYRTSFPESLTLCIFLFHQINLTWQTFAWKYTPHDWSPTQKLSDPTYPFCLPIPSFCLFRC